MFEMSRPFGSRHFKHFLFEIMHFDANFNFSWGLHFTSFPKVYSYFRCCLECKEIIIACHILFIVSLCNFLLGYLGHCVLRSLGTWGLWASWVLWPMHLFETFHFDQRNAASNETKTRVTNTSCNTSNFSEKE